MGMELFDGINGMELAKAARRGIKRFIFLFAAVSWSAHQINTFLHFFAKLKKLREKLVDLLCRPTISFHEIDCSACAGRQRHQQLHFSLHEEEKFVVDWLAAAALPLLVFLLC